MKNKHEDKFWEQMKEAEKKKLNWMKKESSHPESNKKKKNPLFFWGVSLGVAVVLYAIISLLPNQSTVPAIDKINDLSGKGMEEKVIHDYLIQTQGLGVEIGQQLNKMSDTTRTEGFTVEQIKGLKEELVGIKAKAHTDVTYLVPMQEYYLNQSSIVEKIMDEMIEVKEDKGLLNAIQIRELKKEYNSNALQEQDVTVALFEKAGVHFEIQEDGSLYYEIDATETK